LYYAIATFFAAPPKKCINGAPMENNSEKIDFSPYLKAHHIYSEDDVFNGLIYSLSYFYFLFQGKAQESIIDLVMSDLHILLPYYVTKFEIKPLFPSQDIDQVISCEDKKHEIAIKSATVLLTFSPLLARVTEMNYKSNASDQIEIELFMKQAGKVFAQSVVLERLKKTPKMFIPTMIQNVINGGKN